MYDRDKGLMHVVLQVNLAANASCKGRFPRLSLACSSLHARVTRFPDYVERKLELKKQPPG